MVSISQLWMIHTMERAIVIAQDPGVTPPSHITIYMDDCRGVIKHQPTPRRPGLRSSAQRSDPAAAFNDCLNLVHPCVKFTREEEVDDSIAFLDVNLTRLSNGRISTGIYRKPSNTNVIIKPHSCQHPNTILSTFKSELCRAHRLCSSTIQTKEEIDLTLNVFQDNGHNRNCLKDIVKHYIPPPSTKTRPSTTAPYSLSQPNPGQQNHHNTDPTPVNLFSILPFHGIHLD
jgi:hypothetical protein